jgi:hypothetical protein
MVWGDVDAAARGAPALLGGSAAGSSLRHPGAQPEEELHREVTARCEVGPEVDGHVEKKDG